MKPIKCDKCKGTETRRTKRGYECEDCGFKSEQMEIPKTWKEIEEENRF